MNLINLKNYLNLVNPSKNFEVSLTKELTIEDVVRDVVSIYYLCTLIPRHIRISQNKSEELILEADKDELYIYFPWLYKALNIEYLKSRKGGTFGTFEVKVYKVTMKD